MKKQAKRTTLSKIPAVILTIAAWAVLGVAPVFVPGAEATLTLRFDTFTGANETGIWLQLQDPNFATAGKQFQASYANGTENIDFSHNGSQVLMSQPVSLDDIGDGGLDITFSESAVFYIFYDDPSNNSRTAAPSQAVSKQRFQPFELTMMGNDGDQGNLTAINYFTAPLSIRSYENDPAQDPAQPPLQQTGFGNATAAEIGALYASITAGNDDAVVKNDNGGIVRYLGPSNVFNDQNPWPSFIPYTQSINAAGQVTHLLRSNGFNFAAPDDTPVYQFGMDMNATAASDGSVVITGNITATANTDVKDGNPALPETGKWTNATFTLSAADVDAFNNAIYGQVANSAVSFTGQAWTDFQEFTNSTLKDPSLAHNATTNPSLNEHSAAYATTRNMFIGEITTGLLGGFLNSGHTSGGEAIKDMSSNQWWSLQPLVAFSQIQPDNEYYNTYADVIFQKSGNTVYGVPYSDRFGSGPLVNTVKYNGSDVNYWIVGVGAPLSTKKGGNSHMHLLLLQE